MIRHVGFYRLDLIRCWHWAFWRYSLPGTAKVWLVESKSQTLQRVVCGYRIDAMVQSRQSDSVRANGQLENGIKTNDAWSEVS